MTQQANIALIPRADLFGNPSRMGTQISPDGAFISWIAPLDGVPNIWLARRDAPDEARALTRDRGRGITSHFWCYMAGRIVFVQDTGGDENWHVHMLDVASGLVQDVTPFEGVQAHLHSASPAVPGHILVTHNKRDRRFGDLYRLDLSTGKLDLVMENPGFAHILCDASLQPRVAVVPHQDGGMRIVRNDLTGSWSPIASFTPSETSASNPIGVTADGSALLLSDSRGRNTAALVRMSLADGQCELLATNPRADIRMVLTDVSTREALAYVDSYDKPAYIALDPAIAVDFQTISEAGLDDWTLMGRTQDGSFWLLGESSPLLPGNTYLYDRLNRHITLLHCSRPTLAEAPLCAMEPCIIPARDGLMMVSYLTRPKSGQGPSPLVLLVHGGPQERDRYGFNPMHQWLANRGYAVLSVNFRGSTGFGVQHVEAGLGEWGRKMDDDLLDAAAWAIEAGHANAGKIAIMGGSYGGYATLVGLTRNPGFYACGVDIVGPSNLQTLVDSIPAYWEAGKFAFYRSVGDPGTKAGRALLRERSPVHCAERINCPLLIAHGANDPRVKLRESEQMVAALKANSIPVTFFVFPDEGHGFARAPNRIAANAVIEEFLARHLGGRVEPMSRDELEASTIELREGCNLSAALDPVDQ